MLITDWLTCISSICSALAALALIGLTYWLGSSALKTYKNQLEQRIDTNRPYLSLLSFENHGNQPPLGYGVMLKLKNIGRGPARLLLDIGRSGEINQANLDTPLCVGVGDNANVKTWLPDSILTPEGVKFKLLVSYKDITDNLYRTELHLSLWVKEGNLLYNVHLDNSFLGCDNNSNP